MDGLVGATVMVWCHTKRTMVSDVMVLMFYCSLIGVVFVTCVGVMYHTFDAPLPRNSSLTAAGKKEHTRPKKMKTCLQRRCTLASNSSHSRLAKNRKNRESHITGLPQSKDLITFIPNFTSESKQSSPQL